MWIWQLIWWNETIIRTKISIYGPCQTQDSGLSRMINDKWESDHSMCFAKAQINFLAFIYPEHTWSQPVTFSSVESFAIFLPFLIGPVQFAKENKCRGHPGCSAINHSVLTAEVREHQKAPLQHSFEQHLICGGNLSHKQPRGDFNIYSAVCSAYVSFGKQLTLAHYTQMKADLQTGQRPHSLCGEVSPSYEAEASPPLLCLCIWNSSQGPLQTRVPSLTWCILYVNMVLMYFKMQTRL